MSLPLAEKTVIVAPERDRKALDIVARALQTTKPSSARRSHIVISDQAPPLILPESLFQVISRAVRQLANGNGVSILPVTAELSTQQAAGILNVSRPYVVKLLENGQIPFRLVGTHRRVRLRDVMAYRARQQKKSRAALEALVADSQELDLYDE